MKQSLALSFLATNAKKEVSKIDNLEDSQCPQNKIKSYIFPKKNLMYPCC